MSEPAPLSKEDLAVLIKLQFQMVAQTASEMFHLTGHPGPFRISARIDGQKITAIVGVEP